MEFKIKGPNWFPTYAKSCVEAILLLKKIPKEGIFFVKYPEGWAEEIEGLLSAFFTRKAGIFVKFDSIDFSLKGNIEGDFISLIKNLSFKTGPIEYSFNLREKSEMEYIIELLKNGTSIDPVRLSEYESHTTLLQSIRAAYFLLQENIDFVCFQMNAGCLDSKTKELISKVFSYLNNKIKGTDKNLIVFYSDSLGEFTKEYIWKSNCYNSFAVIDDETKISYQIPNYDDIIKCIKEALECEEYKHLDFFLGAGASIKSGLHSGKAMRLKALQEFTGRIGDAEDLLEEVRSNAPDWLPQDNKKVSLEHMMTLLRVVSGKDDLSQTLVLKEFEENYKKATPSPGYKILKKIAESTCILVVTTNFDQLTEKNLPNPTIIVTESEFKDIDPHSTVKGGEGRHAVVKLHGCRSSPNSIAIHTENIETLPQYKRNFMKAYLRDARPQEIKFSNIFFIGYNFADPDILDVLTEDIEKLRIRPIIVNPKLSVTMQKFMDSFEDKLGKATYIPFEFDFFMETLYKIIQANKRN